MAGVPFISVHVSQQLDNQPLQWKSIVLIGLYLLYNSPAGNPWWQIISAPVFDWCFDVSDLQGQTEELVEALLTESKPAPPRLTPAQKPDLPSDSQTVRRQAAGGQSKLLHSRGWRAGEKNYTKIYLIKDTMSNISSLKCLARSLFWNLWSCVLPNVPDKVQTRRNPRCYLRYFLRSPVAITSGRESENGTKINANKTSNNNNNNNKTTPTIPRYLQLLFSFYWETPGRQKLHIERLLAIRSKF